jgi:hypothetical protein
MKKVILILSNLILIILIVGYLLISGLNLLFGDLCGNDVISEIYSPDKKMKVVVFRRSCGATTGFSTHVSILNAWDKLSNDEAGNVYCLDDVIPLNITWIGNEKLNIVRSVPSATFTKASTHLVLPFFQQVKITYDTLTVD